MTVNRIARAHRRLLGAAGRWVTFRGGFHLAAENITVWLPTRAGLADGPHGQALLDAMNDEQQPIGPLLAVPGDAFTLGRRPRRHGGPAAVGMDRDRGGDGSVPR
jgi:hypothetical protein